MYSCLSCTWCLSSNCGLLLKCGHYRSRFFWKYYLERCSFEFAELVDFSLFYVMYCLLNNLIVCTMFLPPFLHVDRKSVSTVPLLVQLDFKTFCRQNVFGLSYLNGFQSRMKVTFHVSLNHLPFSSVFFFLQLHLLQWVVSLVWGGL